MPQPPNSACLSPVGRCEGGGFGQRCSEAVEAAQPVPAGGKRKRRNAPVVGPSRDEAALLALLELSSEFFARHTPEGVCLYASPSCQELLGYAPEELVGRFIYDFIHPQDAASVRCAHLQVFERPVALTVAFRLRHKNDSFVPVETTGRIIADPESGCPLELISCTRRAGPPAASSSSAENPFTAGGLIPICATCKKMRDGCGSWKPPEAFIEKYFDVHFSHGICPDCARKDFGDLVDGVGYYD